LYIINPKKEGGGSMSLSEEKKFTTVSIPTPLFRKVEERIKGTGFTSVSSYVTYVLREILSEEEEEAEPFTKEDEERVKERLKALGYLD
jgi:Arc/MetJ-type ribon-helix-helix transcriptional regulator